MENNYEIIKGIPSNINELVNKANNKNSWEERYEAIQQLKSWDCQQTRDVISRLAINDRVYKVKYEAFRIAQKLGIKRNGKPISLGKKDTRYKMNDFKKTFARIKRDCKTDELNVQIFKDKFKQVNPEMYDVMLYTKGVKFDEWIENIYKLLPKNNK